jgi:uncharacterized membrane protein YphA (DoxX/SURF4 family)
MSAFDRAVAATAHPLLVLTRLLIGLFLIWVGLTKCVPGWNPLDSDSQAFLGAVVQGHVNPQIALWLIGGWQILTGLTLCIVPSLRLSIVLMWLLLVLYGLIIGFHVTELFDSNGLPTAFAGLALRNCLLTLAGLAIASYTVKVTSDQPAKK